VSLPHTVLTSEPTIRLAFPLAVVYR